MGFQAAVVDSIIYAFGGAYSEDSACDETYAYNVHTDAWISRSPRPLRGVCAVTAYNNRIYTFGGLDSNGTASQEVWVYDPASDSWTQKADMPTARAGMQSVLWRDGIYGRYKIYVIGGYQTLSTGLTIVEAYDPFTNTWETKSDIPEKTMFAGLSIVETNHRQKIYVMGGASSMSAGGQHNWEYDPNGPWVKLTDITPRRVGAGSAVVDGKIYLTGGLDVDNELAKSNAHSLYDPETDSWQLRKEMPTSRGFLPSAVVNGVIYTIGGGYPEPMTTVEAYYPAADTWASRASLPQPRMSLHTAVVGGIIYAIGGWCSEDSGCSEIFAYDPAADSWTTKTPRPTLHGACGVVAYGGLIYTFGGNDSAGVATNGLWVYNPAADSWTEKTGMPAARIATEAILDTVCGMDRIYVMGGYQMQGGSLEMVAAYDPVLDKWERKADMPENNMFAALAEVSGKIYVMGGAASMVSGGRINWEYDPRLDPQLAEGVDDATGVPDRFVLQQNYPNPFNPSTKMSFVISHESFVTLKVFDVLGRDVATLVNEKKRPGEYTVEWNASRMPSGVYFYRITAGKFVQTEKMVLIK